MNQEQTSKESLKVQALTERISSLVAKYENEIADFRVDATLQIKRLEDQINNLQSVVESQTSELNSLRDNNVPQEEEPAGTE